MNKCELSDLQGMDWDVEGGYWYSVANGDVTPAMLLDYTINLEAEIAALKRGLEHIKAWAGGATGRSELLMRAVVRMCDDALKGGKP